MPVTGLFYLPVLPSASTSSAALVSYLSRVFPTRPHTPYHIDHRLFVDTSSLLPSSSTSVTQPASGDTPSARPAAKGRQYTHLLTSSHAPQSTYVGVSSASDADELTLVTIPASNLEAFHHLLNTKLQAQWAQRQAAVLDGASIVLPAREDGAWTIRIGDLRTAGVVGSKSSAAASKGAVRAILVEIEHQETLENNNGVREVEDTEEVIRTQEVLLRDMVKKLFRTFSDLRFDDARLTIKVTTPSADDKPQISTSLKPVGWQLATLYMDTLRGTRS